MKHVGVLISDLGFESSCVECVSVYARLKAYANKRKSSRNTRIGPFVASLFQVSFAQGHAHVQGIAYPLLISCQVWVYAQFTVIGQVYRISVGFVRGLPLNLHVKQPRSQMLKMVNTTQGAATANMSPWKLAGLLPGEPKACFGSVR